MVPFVHLRLHTEFSILDGITRIDEVVKQAQQDGQVALAVTDHCNLFAAVKFYKAARQAGIKPILGCDIWHTPPPHLQKTDESHSTSTSTTTKTHVGSKLTLLAENYQGYLNLCELLSRAWLQHDNHDQAVVEWAWLETFQEGLIALSAAQQGLCGHALIHGQLERAQQAAQALSQCFPDRFYLELQRVGRPHDALHVGLACQLAHDLQLPVVATHPIQFLHPEDFEAHEARVCIAEGEMLSDSKRPRRFTPEQYLFSQKQMLERFADIPSSLINSVEIAKRCNVMLKLGSNCLPDFPTPIPIAEFFTQKAQQGLERRLQARFPNAQERAQQRPIYEDRLQFEINTILKMGFPGYFLIVSDFIQWAKTHGCPVGPGRGSGAGSLVAYALDITDLDPLQYQLLFERFLNPERVSMPDFDIDFCQANRDRVIDYVKTRYGKEAVSQIATFGSMAARAAIRDVGRVLDYPYSFCDGISKLIPNKPGKPVTLQYPPENLKPEDKDKYALLAEPLLMERLQKEEEVKTLLELAQKLEGITRNVGMHAGGVLIAPGKLTDFCPLYAQPGSQSTVSQFDKDDVEAAGLVKFDFLGLATLTILEWAAQMIRQHQPDFSYESIPLDDKKVFELFSKGQTEAVFQFESSGMQGMLRDAKPSRLEDLIALNALYRPGPMDLIPSFVARKHGREPVIYPHPLLEQVLSETYGIMVYQEQVMQTAQILGGYSLGGADLLRRAMGKKKAEEMAEHRSVFQKGAAQNGLSPEQANEIFDLMEKFAGYGFNKSHAAAYSLLAYHTAWVKVHHPSAFYAANMTVEMDNTDKLKVLVEDAKRMGITFEAPNINIGGYAFVPLSDDQVRYGLGAIKGTGEMAIKAMIEAKEGRGVGAFGDKRGNFTSLFDFCLRVDRNRINKRAIEALIKAGAFDSLHSNRSQLLAHVGLAMEWSLNCHVHANQASLFEEAGVIEEPNMTPTPPWSVKEMLSHEKTALGFYFSAHLFDQWRQELWGWTKNNIAHLITEATAQKSEEKWVAGIVNDWRVINSQRGQKLALFSLDDGTGQIEVSLDEGIWLPHQAWLKEDATVILKGTVQADRFSGGVRLRVREVLSVPLCRAKKGQYLNLSCKSSKDPSTWITQMKRLLQEFPPQTETTEWGESQIGLSVRLNYHHAKAICQIVLGDTARFFPTDEALQAWQNLSFEMPEIIYKI